MSLIDFILNLAGLLLWVNWRAVPRDQPRQVTPATLIGTRRRAEPARVNRWYFLAALGALLFLRAWFYWQLGPALNWTARLNLLATRLAFKSDSFGLMLLYSALSFGLLLGVFWLWLLLVSLLGGGAGENLPPLRLARAHLGAINGWSAWKRLLLPLVAGFVVWWLLTWPLAAWGVIPRPVLGMARLAQAALVGGSTYLAWKYLIAALLTLQLLHNHVYLGGHPIWNFVDVAARRLLRPVQKLPLRVAKVDLTPVVGIVLAFIFAYCAENGVPPARMDVNGRREPRAFEIPGLIDLYERASR
jgi:hypothetical protein